MNKRILASILALIYCFTMLSYAAGEFDETILQDAVANTYTGTKDAIWKINNLNFTDIPVGHWAKESIARAGAFNIIKGYEKQYSPNDQVTNQEAIALIIRLIGQEANAQTQAETLKASGTAPVETDPVNGWAYGYLNVAQTLGLISASEFSDALQSDPSILDPATSFYKNQGATREKVAEWLVKGIKSIDPKILQESKEQQAIFNFADWKQIALEDIPYVEAVAANSIMTGDDQNRFNPKGYVTRAEMAQIMRNMDKIYFDALKMKRTTGYIGEIIDELGGNGSNEVTQRTLYVRNEDGNVDKIITDVQIDPIGQKETKDIVVYKDGVISGTSSLKKSEKIEYITNSKNEVLYIYSTIVQLDSIKGKFKSFDLANNRITINADDGRVAVYKIRTGLINSVDQTIAISGQTIPITKMPFSTRMLFVLKDNVIDRIDVIGEEQTYTSIKGIIKSINTDSNQISVVDENNSVILKTWNDDIVVERNDYYNTQDEVGYIDEMFSSYTYDKRDVTPKDLEVGDVVELVIDKNGNVSKISADMDIIVKYGKVKQLSFSKMDSTKILLEYEDYTNELIEVPNDTRISKSDRNISIYDIMPGDWIKLLVKRGILLPGKITEQVKEILVNGKEEYISNLYRGRISDFNKMQEEIVLSDTETFYKSGWLNYRNLFNIKISDNVEWYDNGERVSNDYVDRFLKGSDSDIYIAAEKEFDTEKAIKVTFRSNKEKVLNQDNVNHIDGNGGFNIVYTPTNITTDAGTIVRRYGRLVEPQNISMLDYAKVVLNGENTAAIVDITEEIDNSKLQVIRGRIADIETNKNFTISSFSSLQGMSWSFVPSEKKLNIDHNTKIYSDSGLTDINTFIDYTEASKLDKVYTIIARGGDTLRLLDAPYCTETATGEVYKIDTNNIVYLKNVKQYDTGSLSFEDISRVDNTISMKVPSNGVVINNSEIISSTKLKIGDKIRIMTNSKPIDVKNANSVLNGYIVFVEK